jgi:hypothetical protein
LLVCRDFALRGILTNHGGVSGRVGRFRRCLPCCLLLLLRFNQCADPLRRSVVLNEFVSGLAAFVAKLGMCLLYN